MSLRVGRYIVHESIASGGMATVHLGRMVGPMGFSRTIAIKRLHPHFAQDGEFALMLLDEARVSARIRHPFVVQTLDVVSEEGNLLVVMEYVHGESLAKLSRKSKERGERIDPRIAVTVMVQVLHGLHAAHEVRDESGMNLCVVHRDVSPQNVLVGADGVARVLDFGVAKALGRAQTTREGQIKGKIAYMSPEQLQGEPVDRRTDVFAASIVLWELLTGQRLFGGDDEKATLGKALQGDVRPPSAHAEGLDPALDAIVLQGLARDASTRYQTAAEMAEALEAWAPAVSSSRIAGWVDSLCHTELGGRRERIAEMELSGVGAGATLPEERADEQTKSAHAIPSRAARSGSPRRRGWAWAWVAVPIGALVLGGVYATSRQGPEKVAPAETGASASSPPSVVASAPITPTAPDAVSAAPEPGGIASPPSSAATGIASPPSSAATGGAIASTPPARRATTTPATRTSPVAKVDCSNPYVLDAEGHKRYRRECLGGP